MSRKNLEYINKQARLQTALNAREKIGISTLSHIEMVRSAASSPSVYFCWCCIVLCCWFFSHWHHIQRRIQSARIKRRMPEIAACKPIVTSYLLVEVDMKQNNNESKNSTSTRPKRALEGTRGKRQSGRRFA